MKGEKGGDKVFEWAGSLRGWLSKVVLHRERSARAIIQGTFDAYPDIGPKRLHR